MKRFTQVASLLLLACLAVLAGGCGSSTETKGSGSTSALQASSTEYPNASLLVSPASVQSSAGSGGLIIVDARSTGYETAHVPGAIKLAYGDFFTPKVGLKPVADLEALLGAKGVSRDATIVVYDDTTNSWGAAGRMFWMLEYLGATNVHIMDGGWDKWVADGRPSQSGTVTLPEAVFTANVQSGATIASSRLSYRLYDSDFAVIDSRTDEEFQGWQLYGEARGGHIPKAVHIPYAWFFNSDKTTLGHAELKQLLESRGITPDKEVTAYCTAGIRSGHVYFLLRLMGYPRCSNYDASIWDWAEQSDLPMEKAPRFNTVVYPAWVKSLIDYHKPGSTTAAPPEYPYDRSHNYLIFATHWGSIDDMRQGWADNSYLLGHIPGAIHSNSDVYENGYPRWFLLPDDQLKAAAGTMGITPDTTVVVYSNSFIFSARLWFILKYLGVSDVRIMNGGYQAWADAGYAGETVINDPVPTTYAGTVHPEYLATTDYVAARYAGSTAWVTDVRTGSEFAGMISGYGYLAAKGRVPNAIWAYDADDSSSAYRDADGTLRSYTEVRDLWKSVGITSTGASNLFDREVIFYCGGGYRSSLTFLYAYLMGYDNVRNYSDGWEGWSTTYTEDPSYQIGVTPGWRQDPSGRPVATGWPF